MKLIHPGAGTVVSCEGDLAAHYLARGWRDAEAPAKPVEVPLEKPKTRRARTLSTD